jgi:hypothetical protein
LRYVRTGSSKPWQLIVTKCIVLFTVSLASLPAFAQTSWQGYQSIELLAAEKVKTKAPELIIQIKSVEVLDKSRDSYDVVNTDSQIVVIDRNTLDTDRVALQIETCRNQGLKRCPIFHINSDASAVVGDLNKIYTCRHVIHNWITVAAKENSISIDDISPPVVMLDSKNNVIFNSAYKNGGSLSIRAINTDSRLLRYRPRKTDPQESKIEFFMELSEFVALEAPLSIDKPANLTINTRIVKGDRLYNVGYPVKTSIYGGVSKGDAPGGRLVASAGKVVEFSHVQGVILSTAFSSGGISGGAMMNENGDVVGLNCAEVYESVLGEKSRGVFLDVNGHRALWRLVKAEPL